jgi:hypothetical protein
LDRLQVIARGGGRQQDRQGAGAVRHGVNVFLADHMERMRPDLLDVGHDPDDGPAAPLVVHHRSPGGTTLDAAKM